MHSTPLLLPKCAKKREPEDEQGGVSSVQTYREIECKIPLDIERNQEQIAL